MTSYLAPKGAGIPVSSIWLSGISADYAPKSGGVMFIKRYENASEPFYIPMDELLVMKVFLYESATERMTPRIRSSELAHANSAHPDGSGSTIENIKKPIC